MRPEVRPAPQSAAVGGAPFPPGRRHVNSQSRSGLQSCYDRSLLSSGACHHRGPLSWVPMVQQKGCSIQMRAPTSVILQSLMRDAPAGEVTFSWIVGHLGERSFGIVMLLVALIGLVPGASTVVGVLLAIPAVQMMLGRAEPLLPGRLARRRLSTARLIRLVQRVVPVLQWLERLVRPRWRDRFALTKRLVGFVILLLSTTLLAPIPFSQVIPILVIMLIAFAFLEEDGLLLGLALVAALGSLAITAAAVWGTVEAALSL